MHELDILVGEWVAEVPMPTGPVQARTTFEWLEGGGFLIERATIDAPQFPNGVMVIGGDPLRQHYFDSRGVQRVYEMSLEDGVWRLWRDGDDFSQRFAATFSEDGRTLTGAWEKSDDGTTWEHDFDIVYTKVS